MIPIAIFVNGRNTTEQISTLQQIFEKSWEHTKDVYTCFVDIGNVYGRVPCEKLEGCCRSTVLKGASCWPSGNFIPAQNIVLVSMELNHNSSALALDPTMVCAVTTPLHSLHQGTPNYGPRPNLTYEAISPGRKTHFAKGVTREAQFPGRRVTMGAPNHCGGAEKSQQCHKYFLQYSTFASERTQFRTWRRQTCFLLRAPSNVVTTLHFASNEKIIYLRNTC